MKMGEKSKHAVALKYETQSDLAPRVTAKGRGHVAEKIIAKATEQGIPIQEDPTLVELLHKLQIDQEIPEELFSVVAEIFAFVYRLDKTT